MSFETENQQSARVDFKPVMMITVGNPNPEPPRIEIEDVESNKGEKVEDIEDIGFFQDNEK